MIHELSSADSAYFAPVYPQSEFTMTAFPIEIVQFGTKLIDALDEVISELNGVQSDILFQRPRQELQNWFAPFEHDVENTEYIWSKLREFRTHWKGFHPYIIAIIHGKLSSPQMGNLFGSHEATEGLAVFTTYDWVEHFAPPNLDVYIAYYLVRYTLNFICPTLKNHDETRGCYFDKKKLKNDIKQSMTAGKICAQCRNLFETFVDSETYRSITKLTELVKSKVNGNVSTKRPTAFIGSSAEGLKIAEYLQFGLQDCVDTTIWSQGVFGLTYGTLESLVNASSKFDYALLVLTPDDLVTKRDSTKNSPRDNVLFELGLFMGALGREHTFIIRCRDEPVALPSDLAGVTISQFNKRADGNLKAALGPLCTELKEAMLGPKR